MGRNDEIQIPKCCNYTDLREKKEELSEIEKEKLSDFVKSLSKSEQMQLVKYIDDWHILQNEVTRRHDNADCKVDGVTRAFQRDIF